MAEIRASDLFLSTFKNCVTNIIKTLPSNGDPTDAITTNSIRVIASHLNGEYERLEYVIWTIQARICEDANWASGTAVSVYELLAASIDPKFPNSNLQLSALIGPMVVRDQMMRACQTEFQQIMTKSSWSRGLIAFLGQTCTVGKMTSTTPNIALNILDHMLGSISLAKNENFDIFLGFFMRAGPFLDDLGYRDKLSARVQKMVEIAKTLGTSEWLAVYGLLQMREKDWQVDKEDEEKSSYLVDGVTGDG